MAFAVPDSWWSLDRGLLLGNQSFLGRSTKATPELQARWGRWLLERAPCKVFLPAFLRDLPCLVLLPQLLVSPWSEPHWWPPASLVALLHNGLGFLAGVGWEPSLSTKEVPMELPNALGKSHGKDTCLRDLGCSPSFP